MADLHVAYMTMTTLTAKQEAFCREMAMPDARPLTAYEAAGYSVANRKAAGEAASRLLADSKIVQRIETLRTVAAAPLVAEAQTILREWLTIATADPSELIRARRGCCRHCYGTDHRYQWRDEEEYAFALSAAIDRNAARAARKGSAREDALPDDSGGYGFNRTLTPHAHCPKCNGEGELDVYVADTASLSPAAKKLYAGIRTTQHGIEIKMRDQDGALTNLARYLGMFVEKHEHSGPGGGPIPNATIVAEVDARKAGEIYAAVMAGTSK